ncbi:MAG: DUF1569 domain-containing protein [Pirellulaceae bacterium]|nr:DUF1569 domain-containing protein [Pirellulaceae bacterium]
MDSDHRFNATRGDSPIRRKLQFDTLPEAVLEAERLLESGYEKTGNWDLTQCCNHITKVMLYPIDGFPRFPVHMQIATRLMRYTIAPIMLKRILSTNRWPAGVPTDTQSLPVETGRDRPAVEQFKLAVTRLLTFDGPWQTSPLFGLLEKEQLVHLHRIHTAHHLGFLVPKPDQAE